MDDTKERASLSSLVRDLLQDSSRLVRDEVALAKAEVKENVALYERAIGYFAVAAVLGIAAAVVLLTALNTGLIALFDRFMALAVAVWLAPLVLFVVFAAIALAIARRGREVLKGAHLKPETTLETVEETKEWIRSRAS